jgi:hypothetical protein
MSTREGEITRTMIQGLKLLFRGPDNPLASHYKLCRRLMLGHKHRSESTFVQRMRGSDSTWNYSVARASFHHARVSCYYWCWWSNWPSIHPISASITFIGRHSPCTLAAPYDYQNAVRVEYEIKFHLNLALKASAEWLGNTPCRKFYHPSKIFKSSAIWSSLMSQSVLQISNVEPCCPVRVPLRWRLEDVNGFYDTLLSIA